MSWTTLMAEYLVVGCMASTWITLFALAAAERSPAHLLLALRELPSYAGPALTVIFLLVAYSLGTVVDHLCYLLSFRCLKRWNQRYWSGFHQRGRPTIGRLFFDAEDRVLGTEGQRERLLRRRGRIRIVRAAFFQIPLVGIGIRLHYDLLWPLLFLAVFWLLTGWTLWSVHREYSRMIAKAAR